MSDICVKICYVTHYGIRNEAVLAIQALGKRIPTNIQIAKGRHLTDLHNTCILPGEDVVDRYVKLPDKWTHYLIVDQDVIFSEDVVLEMLAADKDIISAVHPMPDNNGLTAGKWGPKPGWLGDCMAGTNPSGVYKVDWCSDSLMLLSKKALETMERPWWHQHIIRSLVGDTSSPRQVVSVTSPEVGLCLNAMGHGLSIWAYIAKGLSVRYEWSESSLSPVANKLSLDFKGEELDHAFDKIPFDTFKDEAPRSYTNTRGPTGQVGR